MVILKCNKIKITGDMGITKKLSINGNTLKIDWKVKCKLDNKFGAFKYLCLPNLKKKKCNQQTLYL